MKKTAVVYDKWLSSLGGGEVVACNIAKTLINNGYKTTFISGHKVDPKLIVEKLGIDISKAKFLEIWDDESKIKKITKGKDIFVNASFMDYTTGSAKKNIFYTSFPTPPFSGIKGRILINIIIPILLFFIKPREDLTPQKGDIFKGHHLLKRVDQNRKIAFSRLNTKNTYHLKWILFLENFSKSNLRSISWNTENVILKKETIKIDHFHNTIKIHQLIKPLNNTCYLSINNKIKNNILFLIEPKLLPCNFIDFYSQSFYYSLNNRLRAGIFGNLVERMRSFDIVFANSKFTQKWIKKYWKRDSIVLYPPVPFVGINSKVKKQNKICSVGRFFTSGHSKKQEVMIKAFKKMVDNGLKNWELHLAGGLGNEPGSAEFVHKILKLASKYPIYFHFNQSRKFIENLYQSSKIYWHAAGFKENENKNPIKFEHFGIAPIEAMSAGCVPVVYNGGGLPDSINIIGLDPNKHLFNSIDELVTNTQNLIQTKTELDSKSILKIINSNFSKEAFVKKFNKLIH
ncbi:MAG TPA: glycosyltransferase [Candidatus Woesebacteria bacterium]|jgi:glycosyltransferase involved in cell wall biosynthesis|nr:glycosyltransferase [Candidatus Woesebacteria bacterium]